MSYGIFRKTNFAVFFFFYLLLFLVLLESVIVYLFVFFFPPQINPVLRYTNRLLELCLLSTRPLTPGSRAACGPWHPPTTTGLLSPRAGGCPRRCHTPRPHPPGPARCHTPPSPHGAGGGGTGPARRPRLPRCLREPAPPTRAPSVPPAAGRAAVGRALGEGRAEGSEAPGGSDGRGGHPMRSGAAAPKGGERPAVGPNEAAPGAGLPSGIPRRGAAAELRWHVSAGSAKLPAPLPAPVLRWLGRRTAGGPGGTGQRRGRSMRQGRPPRAAQSPAGSAPTRRAREAARGVAAAAVPRGWGARPAPLSLPPALHPSSSRRGPGASDVAASSSAASGCPQLNREGRGPSGSRRGHGQRDVLPKTEADFPDPPALDCGVWIPLRGDALLRAAGPAEEGGGHGAQVPAASRVPLGSVTRYLPLQEPLPPFSKACRIPSSSSFGLQLTHLSQSFAPYALLSLLSSPWGLISNPGWDPGPAEGSASCCHGLLEREISFPRVL